MSYTQEQLRELSFRKWLRNTKGLTHSQVLECGKSFGLTDTQIHDEVSIVNGYVGRKR